MYKYFTILRTYLGIWQKLLTKPYDIDPLTALALALLGIIEFELIIVAGVVGLFRAGVQKLASEIN